MNQYIKSIVEGFDFNNIDNSSKNKRLTSIIADYTIEQKYSVEIKNKILNHIKLTAEEMQLLDTYVKEFRQHMKIEYDELLPLIIYHLVDNKADNLNWIDIDKFCEDNNIGMDSNEKFILTYIPTQEDIIKVKKFLKTIQKLDSQIDNSFSPNSYYLTLHINPMSENHEEIITADIWDHHKFSIKFGETWFDGNYTASEFLENGYLLCLLIKQLALVQLALVNNGDSDISIDIEDSVIYIGYHLNEDEDKAKYLEDIIDKTAEANYIQKNFEIDNGPLYFIWINEIKNLDDALNKLIKFGKEYVKQFNLYIKEHEDKL